MPPEVPIVGLLYRVIASWPQFIIQCMCHTQGGAQIVVVTGLNNTVCCPRCGARFLCRGQLPDGNFEVIRLSPDEPGKRVM